MLSKEENERLTRVGPGTPCGQLLRRYWQPVAIASELTAEKPKQRVRILGEDLVVFRDEQGLEVEAPDGNRRSVSVSSRDFTIERMSSDWLHFTSPSTAQSWVLHLNSEALQLSEMPVFKAEGRR